MFKSNYDNDRRCDRIVDARRDYPRSRTKGMIQSKPLHTGVSGAESMFSGRWSEVSCTQRR